jgi:hypothetical protein
MKAKRNGRAPHRGSPAQDLSPRALGLDPVLYDSALRYFFDGPVPQGNVFDRMLSMPWRDAQVSALHGIGHHVAHLGRPAVERRIEVFVRTLGPGDDELRNYAHAAAQGGVQ